MSRERIGRLGSETFRILSIDGGGARGMIPAVILKEIEQRSGKPTSALFDRICGTSTGAVLACGLTAPDSERAGRPKFRARNVVEIYRKLGEQVFSRGSMNERMIEPMERLLDRSTSWIASHPKQALDTVGDVWKTLTAPVHDVQKLAYVLHDYLGDIRVQDALTELFVYAYDIGSRTPEILGSGESTIPGIFNDYSKYRMYQAATASSAAPPFFAPYRVWKNPKAPTAEGLQNTPLGMDFTVYPDPGGSGDHADLIDGGNGALGNPTLLAMLEGSDATADRPKFVLSLGCGHFQQPISANARKWGLLQWIANGGELLKNLFDGEADVTDMALRMLRQSEDGAYVRWQPSIPQNMAYMDEGDPQDMGRLEDVAQAFISAHDEQLDEVVEAISG